MRIFPRKIAFQNPEGLYVCLNNLLLERGDFPPWQTVYSQFQRWQRSGIFRRLHDHVRGNLRILLGRALHASAGIIDSQSVKNNRKRWVCGYDGAKKIKGRKRQIAVDTEGFLIEVSVTSAKKSDSHGLKALLRRKKMKGLKKLWADNAYQGQDNRQQANAKGMDLEIVKREPGRIRMYDENWKCVWIPIKVTV